MDLKTIQKKLNFCYGDNIYDVVNVKKNFEIKDGGNLKERFIQNDKLYVYHNECGNTSDRTPHMLFYLFYPCKFCKHKFHKKGLTNEEEKIIKEEVKELRQKLKYMEIYSTNDENLKELLEQEKMAEEQLVKIKEKIYDYKRINHIEVKN